MHIPPADDTEAETKHSNIDSGVKKLVNVFWTRVVLGFVSLMGNFSGRGGEWHQQEEQVCRHCANARLTKLFANWRLDKYIIINYVLLLLLL